MNGNVIFDSVEFYKLSQRNTHKAGIRFEWAKKSSSTIKNSAVSGGDAWGFSSKFSENIALESTAFVGARQIGISIQDSNKISLNGVISADTRIRPELDSIDMDMEACFSVCSLPFTTNLCENIKIVNSIAAGCPYAGFIAPGHQCGTAST